ncbi:hypothetical protein [Aliiroseovarius crassostreae]|uniref:hypothetical protein n=1 Tax=Aliiroseovarius crassostreae TaxID=154981 RepID=UPI0021FB05DD|nr:hypothetical protein [Aliiroseovarius crassostreae]UWP99140.1 hypothetical protein K3X53_02995 [Aliiroseovarius crassostreae]
MNDPFPDLQILFAPLLPWTWLAFLAVLGVVFLAVVVWRRLPGWPLRALALLALGVMLTGPKLQEETRDPLPDILLVLSDESASQSLGDRAQMRAQALGWLGQAAGAAQLDLRQYVIPTAPGDEGTLLMPVLDEALATLPLAQLAGVVIVSDGGLQDFEPAAARLSALSVPVHLLQTGRQSDWDRRLTILRAPRFALAGEPAVIQLRVEALGPLQQGPAELRLSVDGAAPSRHIIPVGRDMELPVDLDHAGETVVHLELVPLEGELTDRNNQAALRINAVRDRLRVLLVSGEPHPGTRSWRNLLKSDASVDLVHFTILRPPNKQDGVPVNELSLIPFPTQELFIDKIDEFDLIIFDRYRLRGILPGYYLESVRDYVDRGGAVLVAAGPEFAGAESLSRSPLGEVLPARPTGLVINEAMRPEVTGLGQRHPVTRALQSDTPTDTPTDKPWGKWLRHLEVAQDSGQVVLQSPAGRPLLALDRAGEGRVALIATDQLWLWAREYDGGGPQLELLRRLAHWMMGEPELEDEALNVRETEDGGILVTRQTLADTPEPLFVQTPEGERQEMLMQPDGPGRFMAQLSGEGDAAEGRAQGVYRFSQGDMTAVAVHGAAAPKEFAQPLVSPDALEGVLPARLGRVWLLETGLPRLRAIDAGDVVSGRGWIGYQPRNAYLRRDLRLRPVLPALLWLLSVAGAVILAWWLEGRRRSG